MQAETWSIRSAAAWRMLARSSRAKPASLAPSASGSGGGRPQTWPSRAKASGGAPTETPRRKACRPDQTSAPSGAAPPRGRGRARRPARPRAGGGGELAIGQPLLEGDEADGIGVLGGEVGDAGTIAMGQPGRPAPRIGMALALGDGGEGGEAFQGAAATAAEGGEAGAARVVQREAGPGGGQHAALGGPDRGVVHQRAAGNRLGGERLPRAGEVGEAGEVDQHGFEEAAVGGLVGAGRSRSTGISACGGLMPMSEAPSAPPPLASSASAA